MDRTFGSDHRVGVLLYLGAAGPVARLVQYGPAGVDAHGPYVGSVYGCRCEEHGIVLQPCSRHWIVGPPGKTRRRLEQLFHDSGAPDGLAGQLRDPPVPLVFAGLASQKEKAVLGRGPDRESRHIEPRGKLLRLPAGLSAVAGHDIRPGGTPPQGIADFTLPIGEPLSLRRKMPAASPRRHQYRVATQRRDGVQTAAVLFGTINQLRPGGIERRSILIGGIESDLLGVARSPVLHPQVEIPLAGAVGGIRDELSVPRNGGEGRQPRVGGNADLLERHLRGSRLAGHHPQRRAANQRRDAAGHSPRKEKLARPEGKPPRRLPGFHQLLQPGFHLFHAGEAVSGLFLQAALHDGVKPLVDLRRHPPEIGGRLVKNIPHHGKRRLALKCLLPGQHFVEDASKREDVAAVVHRLALGLFRGDIGYRPREMAFNRGRQAGIRGARVIVLGQPEIQNLDPAVAGDHDVIGFQIAMDNAGAEQLLTEDEIRSFRTLPVFRIGLELTMAFIDPPVKQLLLRLQQLTGYRVIPVFTTASDFDAALKKYRGAIDRIQSLKSSVALEKYDIRILKGKEGPFSADGKIDATMATVMDEIMLRAAKAGASDIHVEPSDDGVDDTLPRRWRASTRCLLPSLISCRNGFGDQVQGENGYFRTRYPARRKNGVDVCRPCLRRSGQQPPSPER